jgi:hypothetical protein
LVVFGGEFVMGHLGVAVETERKAKMQGLEFLDGGIDTGGIGFALVCEKKTLVGGHGALKFGEAFVFEAVVGLAGFF